MYHSLSLLIQDIVSFSFCPTQTKFYSITLNIWRNFSTSAFTEWYHLGTQHEIWGDSCYLICKATLLISIFKQSILKTIFWILIDEMTMLRCFHLWSVTCDMAQHGPTISTLLTKFHLEVVIHVNQEFRRKISSVCGTESLYTEINPQNNFLSYN